MKTKQELLLELRRIELNLSPENLYWDGERPKAQARAAERKLLAERKVVIKALGYEPTSKEIYGY